jgi:hypothetical protein
MLNKIKEALLRKQETNASLEDAKEVVESLEQEELEVKEEAVVVAESVELSKYEEAVKELADVRSALATLQADYSAVKEELVSFQNAAKASAEAVKAAKLESRHKAISAVAGDVKADALMSAVGEMEDAAFDAIVSALSMNVEKEEAAFEEVGVSADADSDVKPTHFKQYLKNK